MHLPPAPPPPPKAGADAGGAPGGGVAGVAWSPCGRLVATRCDSCPQGCWVWDAERALLIALLLHRDPVRDWAWEPAPAVGGEGGGRLALCTGTGTLFLWGPEGASCVALPAAAPAGPGLRLTALHWGAQLAAVSDAGVCIVYTGGA